MIKLERGSLPSRLSDKKKQELIQKFEDKKEAVWNRAWIKEKVLQSSHYKCAYSEVKLRENGADAHLDHFYPKTNYPGMVVDWDNLIPSCSTCNRSKSDKDPKKEPIVNPYTDNPKDFFFFKENVILPHKNNNKAANTIRTLNLNSYKLAGPRQKLITVINEIIKEIKEDFIEMEDQTTIDKKTQERKILYLKKQLGRINRKKAFSACMATAVLDNPNYGEIKDYLKSNYLWDRDLRSCEEEMKFCYLG